MTAHYYLDWYYDKGFSDELVKCLNEDIFEKKSLVFISAQPNDSHKQTSEIEVHEKSWFDQANIFFDAYHFIEDKTPKEVAQSLINKASVIFLCGGYPRYQMQLMMKNDLSGLISSSTAVIMGTSAGGMNMSAAYVSDGKVHEGLALDSFSFEAHFNHDNISLLSERYKLSEQMPIYVAANQNGAVRIKGNQKEIIGNVYRIFERSLSLVNQFNTKGTMDAQKQNCENFVSKDVGK